MCNQINIIKDACKKIVSGGTPLRSNPEYYINGTIPWLKTGDIKKNFIYEVDEYISDKGLANSSAKLIPKNSVLVAMYGDGYTAGSVAVNKIDLSTNQACCNLVIDQTKANYLYIYYYLKGNYNNLVGLKLGGSQQNLNAKIISEFPIWLPSLKNQEKIAAILSAYDDLIENNKCRIALLEKMAEEIYREWFVRFRFPGYQTAEFEKGIPKGWEQVRLDDFCEKVTDGTHDTPKPTETGYYLVTGKNIKNAQIDFNGAYFISENDHKEISKRSGLKQWDILYSNIGTIGQTAIVGANPDFSVKNVIIFRPKDYSHCIFLSYVLKNPAIAERLMMMSSGASQQFIGLGAARGFKILQPSTKLISQFGERVVSLFNQVDTLIKINKNLETAKATLLPRLISGKLSVKYLDIQFPPSMLSTQAEMS